MGFHIPDSPRSRTSSTSSGSVETRSVSVSVGTSMAGEDTNALSPPSPIAAAVPAAPRQVRRQQQRRNAMIPILAAEAMAALNPEGVVPMDATQAMLQFQDQLRSRGLLPPSDQAPKQPNTTDASSTTANAGTSASLARRVAVSP